MECPVYTKETCPLCECNELEYGDTLYKSSSWDGGIGFDYICPVRFCPLCGREFLKEGTSDGFKNASY